jgi:dihydrodipicolinate synthase/N-acetylneuraminate lyase
MSRRSSLLPSSPACSTTIPVAYKTDFLPEQIAELAAEHANSGGCEGVQRRCSARVPAIREVLGDRLEIFVGVDDVLVEAVNVGAKGWVAGLVNAFPGGVG